MLRLEKFRIERIVVMSKGAVAMKSVNTRDAVSPNVRRPTISVIVPPLLAHEKPADEGGSMPAQDRASPDRKKLPKAEGRHRISPKRSSHRLVAANALASLFAISATLYPLSNNSQLLDLYPPKYGLADPPMSAEVDVIDVPQVILRDLEQMLPDLVESVDDYVPGPADDSSDFAKSLPLLRSLAFVAQASPGLLGAGGGGGGGRPEGSALQGVPTELLLTVGKLLEFLTQRLSVADIATLQAAGLNRLIEFLQLKFPGLAVREIAPVGEAAPAEAHQPEISAAIPPLSVGPVQTVSGPLQTAVLEMVGSAPITPPIPEVVAEPQPTPRDVSLLKPHLTTPASGSPDTGLTGTRSIELGKTLSTVAPRDGSVSGTLGSVTGSVGSVTDSLGSGSGALGSVSRSLDGSSRESDAGSSSGG